MRTLEETLKNATHIKVRDYKRYSFGSVEECKALFIEAFKLDGGKGKDERLERM